MVVKVFKISTMEMWILGNKAELIDFIEQETKLILPRSLTIAQLIKYLPIEDYHRIK